MRVSFTWRKSDSKRQPQAPQLRGAPLAAAQLAAREGDGAEQLRVVIERLGHQRGDVAPGAEQAAAERPAILDRKAGQRVLLRDSIEEGDERRQGQRGPPPARGGCVYLLRARGFAAQSNFHDEAHRDLRRPA